MPSPYPPLIVSVAIGAPEVVTVRPIELESVDASDLRLITMPNPASGLDAASLSSSVVVASASAAGKVTFNVPL